MSRPCASSSVRSDLTGGHPQDTMQVCAALYYLMRDAGSRSVTPDLLEVAYEQAMRELERPFRSDGRTPAGHDAGLRRALLPDARRRIAERDAGPSRGRL